MSAPPPPVAPEEAAALTRQVTRLSVAVAVVLIAVKAFAWGASDSVALLASLIDSALDLVASLVTFFAVRWAAVPADADHRFGHGKAEAFAGLVQAGLVFASSVMVGWEAVSRIVDPRPVSNGDWAVLVMAFSIAVTGFLVAAQTRVLRKTGSIAVQGDRAHYVADLASNLVALIGVASAAWLGAVTLDAAAGLVVAVWLFWGAINVLREAAQHLLDRALPTEVQARIIALVLADPQISGVHRLRTRASGQTWLVTLHADFDPDLTLERAHDLMVAAEARIQAEFPQADVLIHPDPRGRCLPPSGAAEATAPDLAPAPAPSSDSGPSGPWGPR